MKKVCIFFMLIILFPVWSMAQIANGFVYSDLNYNNSIDAG